MTIFWGPEGGRSTRVWLYINSNFIIKNNQIVIQVSLAIRGGHFFDKHEIANTKTSSLSFK